MVDVKRVTASIKKVDYYTGVNTSVTNETVNFNPSDNPPNTYTIDPFAIFQQESNALKVKIPFTRFYKIKCALSISDTSDSTANIDQFALSKPLLTCSESLSINRLSNGVTTPIKSNIYNQDGSGFLVYDPDSVPVSTFTIRKILTPALIEGIVELYAGDVLTFVHTRTMFKKAVTTAIYAFGNLSLQNPGGEFGTGPYGTTYLNRNPTYTGTGIYQGDLYSAGMGMNLGTVSESSVNLNPSAYLASGSFFFEISEITDL